MASPARRSGVVALAVVVVLALGVGSWALWSRGASATARDALVPGGGPPSTARFSFSLSTGSSFSASGTLSLDLRDDRIGAVLQVPVATSDTTFEVSVVGGYLDLTSPNLQGGPGPSWYRAPLRVGSLRGLASLLRRPSPTLLGLLAGARVRRVGHDTHYEGTLKGLGVGTFTSKATSTGVVTLRVTTGEQGQVVALGATLTSGSSMTTITLRALSYDQPVTVESPPASGPFGSATELLSDVLHTGVLGNVVLPEVFVHFITALQTHATSGS